jgi:hypothetical protein
MENIEQVRGLTDRIPKISVGIQISVLKSEIYRNFFFKLSAFGGRERAVDKTAPTSDRVGGGC